MKHRRQLTAPLLSLLLFLPLAGCFREEPEPTPEIYFSDPGLEQGVRTFLRIPEGEPLRERNMERLILLKIWPDRISFNSEAPIHLEGVEVESLEDLRHLYNLGSLSLAQFDMEDVDFLEVNDKLQRLILYENPNLRDIGVVARLPKLVVLSLHKNPSLRDYTPIGEAERLRQLDLHQCGLTDIGFLSELSRLQKLILHNNRIADLTPLEGCVKLEQLDLRGNLLIEDIAPLASLENLNLLRLEGNFITDLTPLSELEHLERLRLDLNHIQSLEPLEAMESLRYVSLSGNRLDPEAVSALQAALGEGCQVVWKEKARGVSPYPPY